MPKSNSNKINIIPIAGSLKNLKQAFVRECTEEEKGEFIAYVDQKGETFDVSITLNTKGELMKHSCDCIQTIAFCEHKEALLQFIMHGKEKSIPEKRKKKQSPTEILLNQLDPEALKLWLIQLLTKNKDLELSFIKHFSPNNHEFTPMEVQELTNKVVKAVVKNKRKLEAGEVKKIVDLWTEVHEPILTHYYNYVNEENAFNNFHSIIDSCEQVLQRVITSSNRIASYLEKLILEAKNSITNQKDDLVWEKSIAYFLPHLFYPYDEMRMRYFVLLEALEGQGNSERNKKYAHILLNILVNRRKNKEIRQHSRSFTFLVFNNLEKYSTLDDYIQYFKPIEYENKFNEKLIDWHIHKGQYDLAEKYCLEQIQGNYQDHYNIPYLQLLKKIYIILKDDLKLVQILKTLFPLTFHFQDYLEILNKTQNLSEQTAFRNRILGLARNLSSRNNHEATQFSMELLSFEKKYSKMIEYLNYHMKLSLILTYAGEMIQADRVKFLLKILEISNYQYFNSFTEVPSLDNYFIQIKDILNKHFTPSELKKEIDNAYKKGVNRISTTLEKLLSKPE